MRVEVEGQDIALKIIDLGIVSHPPPRLPSLGDPVIKPLAFFEVTPEPAPDTSRYTTRSEPGCLKERKVPADADHAFVGRPLSGQSRGAQLTGAVEYLAGGAEMLLVETLWAGLEVVGSRPIPVHQCVLSRGPEVVDRHIAEERPGRNLTHWPSRRVVSQVVIVHRSALPVL